MRGLPPPTLSLARPSPHPAPAGLSGPFRPAACEAPKIHVDCSNLTALATRSPRPVSCQTLAAGHVRSGGAAEAGGAGGSCVALRLRILGLGRSGFAALSSLEGVAARGPL